MRVPVAVLAAVATVLALAPPQARGQRDGAGSVHRFDLERFRQLGTIDAPETAAEFGTTVLDRFVVTAPGADGGGEVFFVSDEEVVSSLRARDLDGGGLARLGEDWADLGHPPGTQSALVFGAPGEPEEEDSERLGMRAAVRPAAVILDYSGGQFTGEVDRVTGRPGSMFGWRVESTDSRFPEASFNGAFLVSAPYENRGKKRARAGAVYKFDTETGRRLWRFRSKRGGELAGYSLKVIPDRDADGFADVLVGAPGSVDLEIPGRLYLLSGRTGRVLEQIEAPEGAVLFGYEVASGSEMSAVPGVLVSAPATPNGKKKAAGAVYVYEDLDAEPELLRGRQRDEWFGISLAQSPTHLFVGSFERHRKPQRDGRGAVTVLLPSGKKARKIRGTVAGQYLGRAIAVGAALAVGAPGAPPVILPE